MLEWYNGVLILTTDRVGHLDEAVQSRVHLCIPYGRLSLKQTLGIFDLNIKQLQEVEWQRTMIAAKKGARYKELMIDVNSIYEFATRQFEENKPDVGRWNGRQIRNAFVTASSLAHSESDDKQDPETQKQLNGTHFEKVQQVTKMFDSYMISIDGTTRSEKAHQWLTRYDNFHDSQVESSSTK
jgi:hypothetical protein